MKKVFIGTLLMMFASLFVACSSKPDISSLVEKAKSEGKDWNEDQWRDAFVEMWKNKKIVLVKEYEFDKNIKEAKKDKDRDAKKEYKKKKREFEKENKDFERDCEKLTRMALDTEVGREVFKDDKLKKEIAKDLGLEEYL